MRNFRDRENKSDWRFGFPTLSFGIVTLLALLAIFTPMLGCSNADSSDKAIIQPAVGQAPPTQSSHANLGKGDLYALVVGVAKYKIPKLNLKVSDNDATQFAEFLKTQQKVFKNTHVKLLTNEAATKMDIEKLLHYELIKAGKDDTVILFFSGHGSADPKKPGDFFFLSHDADPAYLAATAVKMSGLSFLKGIDAHRILVVADACHAGAFSEIRTKSAEKDLTTFAQRFSESSGRVVLSSSKPDQVSQEKPGLNNSVFTHYLLKGLNGEADANRDGVVTVNEAYEYVYEQTRKETGGGQSPQLEGSVHGSFPVSVLGKLDDSIKLEVSFIAQDPRCTNKLCTDPPDERTVCDDPLCTDVELENGTTMYLGQNYQIGVRPSTTSHIYVYHIGPKGDLYRLFPGTDYLSPENRISNPLKGGEIHWVPAKDAWLRQDDQQGKEKIYVVASRSRNQILEDLYTHLEQLRNQGGSARSTQTAQKEMEDYMDRTMAPTKSIIQKVENVSDDRKTRAFEELRGFFESPTLDAVRSVSFENRNR